jgi:hypothetical protein
MQPTTVAAMISSASMVTGIVFGSLTLRQWSRTRSLTAAVELVRTLQTPDFTRSIARIVELPLDVEPEVIRADPALVAAVFVVTHALESLGVLVFHRLLPLHVVDHLVGGYVRGSFRRVKPYVIARREVLGNMFGEWYQWLAEQLEEYPAPGKSQNAAVVHQRWKP